MNWLSLIIVTLFSINTFAAINESVIQYQEGAPYTLEPSVSFSSINDGSRFLSIAFTGRVNSWLRLGMEFDMPADFNEDAQIYQARILGRLMLLDRADKIYLQGSAAYAVFNYTLLDPFTGGVQVQSTSTTDTFYMMEAMAGYARALSSQWHLGARMGVQYAQYSPALAAAGQDWEGDFFYNRVTVFGNYVF